VTSAAPREVLANVNLGRRLRDEQDGVYQALGVSVSQEFRPTKEYPKGQEVYVIGFSSGPDEVVAPDDAPPVSAS